MSKNMSEHHRLHYTPSLRCICYAVGLQMYAIFPEQAENDTGWRVSAFGLQVYKFIYISDTAHVGLGGITNTIK